MAKKLYGAAAAAHAKRLGRSRRKTPSRAIVRTRTRTVTRHVKSPRRRRGRRHGGGGGGIKLTHLALATAGLAFVTSSEHGPKAFTDIAAKIPGSKTFGTAAMVGVIALAVDRFVKPNRWLKLLGTAGVVLAASKIGEQGTDFKFTGDVQGNDGGGSFDLSDESGLDMGDMDGDDDMGDDVEGDDDMGDDEVGDDE